MIGGLTKIGSIGSKARSFAGTTKGKVTLGGLGFGGAGELSSTVPSINPWSGEGIGTGEENTVNLGSWGQEDYGNGGGGNGGLGLGIPPVALIGAAVVAAIALFGGGD